MIDRYFSEIDAIYKSKGLPAVSQYKNDYSFCRSIWSVVRMNRWPRLQQWRYAFYEKLLNSYLQNKDLDSPEVTG